MSTCASASRELAEPLAGTSATARTWLLIEQPGPWGAKALTSSHLDPQLGRALERAAKGTGVRIALIRRPGRHADRHSPTRRRVYAAHTLPGRSWIRTTELTVGDAGSGPEELLALDFAGLGAGRHEGLWQAYDGAPLAFVCTNGKRDRCCALLGRPLAAELAADWGQSIWEVTHMGGHRFAPTLFLLPYGYAYGRATAHAVKGALEAVRDGRIVTAGSRSRSAWDRPGQAAELAVRELTGEEQEDALDVVGTDVRPPSAVRTEAPPPVTGTGTHVTAEAAAPRWTVTLTHTDGRSWHVEVAEETAEPPRPESCGATAGTPARMAVLAVQEVAGSAF
ncbi:sucrase ferredoxin [Streptomyces sp. 8N706]|uniref:sucrase ferredoxin n=1 Tax=Streptomyces sp. 8N706 TaxID=3457416 RepID=UPI003FD42B5E